MVLWILVGFVVGVVLGAWFGGDFMHKAVTAATAGNSGKVPPGQEKK